ncbi:ABC transporter ATP-binding protein [Knoellia koreensis]|uniref:ABC transporter ATP-binding protein n=1 Tax=Knoellia koreensis TaxID=2730921 RepID=A0A849HJ19_9MICO|nr:ABC transporter ATP-binding protein [Knoellia sp. DB2414S]NNM44667.1 ABC transporter ATP-binding protein [Knoellia sp. DB2414S]
MTASTEPGLICTPTLTLEQIYLAYGESRRPTIVLEGVSLAVSPGSMVCVAGRSGSGKTTLLKVAHGALRPDTGRVLWEGEDIAPFSSDQLALKRRNLVGYVPQDSGLIETMTAFENVLVPRMPERLSRKDVDRARMLMADLGLRGRENHRPNALSGGERQRVALARALINDPAIVLADEPTSGLDRSTADRVIDILVDVAKDRAVLVASHDPGLIIAAQLTHQMEALAIAPQPR